MAPVKLRFFQIVLLFMLLLSGNCVFAIKDRPQELMTIEENAKLSIADCLNIALHNNPTLQKYKYNWMIARQDLSISKSAYFPTIGAEAGFSKFYGRTDGYSYSSKDFPSVGVTLQELIWDFGKTFADINMNKFNVIVAKYAFEDMSWVKMYDVKVNYYKVLAAKATVEVEGFNVKLNERNYQRVKAYFEEGIRSRIDLVNAEANLSDSKVKLIEAEKAYKEAVVALNNTMYVMNAPDYELIETDSFNISAMTPPTNLLSTNYIDISDNPSGINDALLASSVQQTDYMGGYKMPEFGYTFDECYDLALQYRCDLQVLKQTVNVMKESLKVIKRQYMPKLTGNLSYDYDRVNSINDNSFYIGLNLKTSLNPLKTKHEIDIGKIKVLRAQVEADNKAKDIYFDLQKYFVQMREYERQIPIMAAKVKQTMENLELADGRYAVGLSDYIELQDARAKYNNAQINYILTVFNYNIAKTKVEQTTALPPNGMEPEDLK